MTLNKIYAWSSPKVSLMKVSQKKSLNHKKPCMVSNRHPGNGSKNRCVFFMSINSRPAHMIFVFLSNERWNIYSSVLIFDDFLITVNSRDAVLEIEAGLSNRFDMMDCEETKVCFGLGIYCDRLSRKPKLSEKSYLSKVLDRISMLKSKLWQTPMEEESFMFILLSKNFPVQPIYKPLTVWCIWCYVPGRTLHLQLVRCRSSWKILQLPCGLPWKHFQVTEWKERSENYDWYVELYSWQSHHLQRLGLASLQAGQNINVWIRLQNRWKGGFVEIYETNNCSALNSWSRISC